jgi:hypothetical protein
MAETPPLSSSNAEPAGRWEFQAESLAVGAFNFVLGRGDIKAKRAAGTKAERRTLI